MRLGGTDLAKIAYPLLRARQWPITPRSLAKKPGHRPFRPPPRPSVRRTRHEVRVPADFKLRHFRMFIHSFCSERTTHLNIRGGPSIIIILPQELTPDQIETTLGRRPLRWKNVMSRFDTSLYLERVAGRPEDNILERLARETIISQVGAVTWPGHWRTKRLKHNLTPSRFSSRTAGATARPCPLGKTDSWSTGTGRPTSTHSRFWPWMMKWR
jgi:hypothetical protein